MFEEPTLLGKRFFTQMLILDWAEITLKISGLDLENPRSTSFWATDLFFNVSHVTILIGLQGSQNAQLALYRQ